jgi:predicted DCC family thiol-disulfide oxidoreductase YuxK
MNHPVVLYDGVCGLCNRVVRFVVRRDKQAVFQYATLQSPWSAKVLSRHGANATDLDTFYVVIGVDGHENGHEEKLLFRSDAVIYVLRQLGGIWRVAARAFQILPRRIRDWMYRLVARNRYRLFGKHETCPLPTAEERKRFVERANE